MTLAGQSVLVTGASGAFGQAFTRYALDQGARRVAAYARGEAKLAAMAAHFNDPRLRILVGDVRDSYRLMDALRDVDCCIHAAALKRVEVCEADPDEAVETNIRGTRNVARACIERGVKRAIYLSTDKAAAPNTLYGHTKATGERIWLGCNVYAAGTATRFACTRYGNVLASTGSVVPLWKQQAAAGKSLTITDARMTRFFMRMEEAVDLVALALERMRGGEVFIPKIGRAWVTDLACAVAPHANQVSVGLRPGEKLHELLMTEEEARHSYDADDVYVIEPEACSWEERPAPVWPSVGPGFVYRSDQGRFLSVEDLRQRLEGV